MTRSVSTDIATQRTLIFKHSRVVKTSLSASDTPATDGVPGEQGKCNVLDTL